MMRILCAVILAIAAVEATAADRYALVIGNGAYKTIDPLPNPPNDVRLVSEALKKVGFEVTLLVDADRRTMDTATKKFARRLDDAGKNAVGVFYFAGHGVSYEGENWLLPVGVEIKEGVDIEYEAYSANKVLKLMENARNATDILILDACRNSPFRSFSLSGTRAVSRGMSRMDAPQGSFIAYSTAPGAVAYDGEGNYSPFAEAFAAELNTPGNSIGDMMIEVRKRVRASTQRLGPAPQTPWDSSSLTGRFAFVPGTGAQPVVSTPTNTTPAVQSTAPAGPSADARLWTSIEGSTDPAEFDFYLKRYPDGQYAELARIRRDRLTAKAKAEANNRPSAPADVSSASVTGAAAGNGNSSGGNAKVTQVCREFADGDSDLFRECFQSVTRGDATLEDFQFDDSFDDFEDPMVGMNVPNRGMQQPPTGGNIIWYDDQANPWQINMNGSQFAAAAMLPGIGPIGLTGQIQGTGISFYIYDGNGNQIGYGQGMASDPTHINYTSYYSNGVFLGSGTFHINHLPN